MDKLYTQYYVYTMEYSAIKKILPFVATWMKLKGIMTSEVSQTKKGKYFLIAYIYVESKRVELIETEKSLVIARSKQLRVGIIGRDGQMVQTSSYNVINF